jgi:hypothetical protein
LHHFHPEGFAVGKTSAKASPHNRLRIVVEIAIRRGGPATFSSAECSAPKATKLRLGSLTGWTHQLSHPLPTERNPIKSFGPAEFF